MTTEDPTLHTDPNTRLVVAIAVVFFITLLIVSFITEPTPLLKNFFRVVLALFAGAIGGLLPGFLDIRHRNWLRAGGGAAFFVLVYLVNPGGSSDTDVEPEPGAIDKCISERISPPASTENLTSLETEQLSLIQSGKYVDVKLKSFLALVALSGQVAESEMVTFLCNALPILRSDADYFATGNNAGIVVGSSWEIQFYRIPSREVFRTTQDAVLKVVEFILANRSEDVDVPQDLKEVEITIRGTLRFFDIKGIRGAGARSWIAFDLRKS